MLQISSSGRIRGLWYIDSRLGELRYRVMAICPVAPEATIIRLNRDDKSNLVDLFWVYFPACKRSVAPGESI